MSEKHEGKLIIFFHIFFPLADAVKELSQARAKAESAAALEEMVASLTQQKVSHAEQLDAARKEARAALQRVGDEQKKAQEMEDLREGQER